MNHYCADSVSKRITIVCSCRLELQMIHYRADSGSRWSHWRKMTAAISGFWNVLALLFYSVRKWIRVVLFFYSLWLVLHMRRMHPSALIHGRWSTFFFDVEVNLWVISRYRGNNENKNMMLTVKMFALQNSVSIIKIIHWNNMVRHTNFQYQAKKKKKKLDTGSMTLIIYKWQRPFLREEKGGYCERCVDMNACKTEQNAEKKKKNNNNILGP